MDIPLSVHFTDSTDGLNHEPAGSKSLDSTAIGYELSFYKAGT
jgi:hypothetical protein